MFAFKRPRPTGQLCLPTPGEAELPNFLDLPLVRRRIAQKASAERAHAPARRDGREGARLDDWSE